MERANQGTVVLLSIECLEGNFQKRLYQIFNELSDYDIDVRVIATTTKNLSKLVGVGRFYRGLYSYFLSNIVNLIPLRERPDDLKYITEKFLEKMLKEGQRVEISSEGMEKLLAHYWTHNIHELKLF